MEASGLEVMVKANKGQLNELYMAYNVRSEARSGDLLRVG
jgi:hypothetical protein